MGLSSRTAVRQPVPPAQSAGGAASLADSLAAIVGAKVTVLGRKPLSLDATFPAEVLTCAEAGGRTFHVFCKHATRRREKVFGHKSGVEYETAVYDHVLRHIGLSLPRFYGPIIDDGRACLALEYLRNTRRVDEAPEGMARAARWVAQFHTANQTRTNQASLSFLRSHRAAYYRGWIRRTRTFSASLSGRYPWLGSLCSRPETLIEPLLTSKQTIIHGEFGPKNILLRAGRVFPVDWESAAIAAGELDLAALVDRWPDEIQQECVRAYRSERWPKDAPVEFERALAAAQLHQQFRWLGDRAEWTLASVSRKRFEALRAAAERLGVM
jgi:hypothetical protein